MSDSTPQRSSVAKLTAPVVVVVGLIIAAGAWMLPVNLKSVSPALLQAAGAGTPTLGSYGRDLVDVEKIGPAALVLAAANTVNEMTGTYCLGNLMLIQLIVLSQKIFVDCP